MLLPSWQMLNHLLEFVCVGSSGLHTRTFILQQDSANRKEMTHCVMTVTSGTDESPEHTWSCGGGGGDWCAGFGGWRVKVHSITHC